jgi:S1-C subfamily serine protease
MRLLAGIWGGDLCSLPEVDGTMKRVVWAVLAAALCSPALETGASELDVRGLARSARPSVVELVGTVEDSGDTSYGTGFVVAEPGLVVTNAHVVQGVGELLVRSYEGALLASVEVLHTDAELDLAAVRVVGLDAPPMSFDPEARLDVGTPVVAVGHPRGYEYTVSEGIVSARRKLSPEGIELIQMTTPISPGSSGGPLLDGAGRVVGVCSLTLTEGQNINFAIPAGELPSFLDEARRIEKSLAGERVEGLPPQALARLVREHRTNGELGRAGELVRRALRAHPDEVTLLEQAAEVAWTKGDYDRVGELVDRIAALRPDYAPAHQIRAAWLAQRGDCHAAIPEARRALEGDMPPRQRAEAHAVLAECLGRSGEAEEALRHVDRALASDHIDQIPDYHVLKAFLLQLAERELEADREAVVALETSRWDPVVVAALRERGLPRLVEIVSSSGRAGETGYAVSGVVRNRGPVPLTRVVVTVEGLDREGEVVASGSARVEPERLVPGQTGAFRARLEGAPERVASYEARIVDYQE